MLEAAIKITILIRRDSANQDDWLRITRDPPTGSIQLGPATSEMIELLMGCMTILLEIGRCKDELEELSEQLTSADALELKRRLARLDGLLQAFVGLFDGALGGEFLGHPSEGIYTLDRDGDIHFLPDDPDPFRPAAFSILGLNSTDKN